MNKAAEAARINVGESAVVAFSTDYETHVVNPPTSQGMKDGKPWYRYRVKINGETRGLFAKGMGEEDGPPHDVIQGFLTEGKIILSLANSGGGDWAIEPASGQGVYLPPQNTPPPQGAVPATAAPPRGKPWGDMVKLMIQCMEQGKHLASGLENATSEDARTIGTSLFIECNRKGITAESIKWEAGKPDESDDDLPF